MITILVPTDFSENAYKATRYAINLLKAPGGKIIMLHAWDIPSARAGMLVSLKRKIEEDAAENMHDLRKKLEHEIAGTEIILETLIYQGSTPEVVTGTAKAREVDLIVMGTQGASGMEGLFLGSVTSHVLERSTNPVLAVPREAEFNGIGQIVYATDSSREKDEPAFELLRRFARFFKATIHVLHIIPVNTDENTPRLNEIAHSYTDQSVNGNIKFVLYHSDNVAEGILEFIKEFHDADLVSMLTRKRGFFGKFFDPSLTKKIALMAQFPLLAYQEKK